MKKLLAIILFAPSFLLGGDLILKVGDGAGYEDGDILVAVNDTRVLDVHAQHIVNRKNMPRSLDGHLNPGCLLDDYLSKTKQYRFERISERDVIRTDLWDGDVDLFNDVTEKYMDVPLYIERRLKHKNHLIFGSKGMEYWYGGRTRKNKEDINYIWEKIERKTGKLKANHTKWPFTDREKKKHLAISVDDFTDAEADLFVEPVFDDKGKVVKARKRKVDYKNIGLDEEILTKAGKEKTDARNPKKDKLSIIKVKK